MNLETALRMEVEGEEKQEVEETLMELGFTGFLTKPISTTIVDACNGFNGLIHLKMMCTVRHHWLAGTRFTLNIYNNWAHILL